MTVRILVGDVRARLADLPDGSVQCVVTSPPYFGLRDYGTAQWDGGDPACDHKQGTARRDGGRSQVNGFYGSLAPDSDKGAMNYRSVCGKCGATRIDNQIGLEPTLAGYIATMVDVFREVRRVLRPDGTLWLNIGDSYASSGGAANGGYDGGILADRPNHAGTRGRARVTVNSGVKPKDLMMVPARLAIALCDDGWYLRSDIIWHKRAPMPESVTDRPTSAHEHIFLLTKQPRYFYDADAVREESQPSSIERVKNGWNGNEDRGYVNGPQNHMSKYMGTERAIEQAMAGRNQRNVWTLSPEPYPDAHFATFPTEIPRRCIKAGTSEKGCCAACGAPWVRMVEPIGEYAEALQKPTWSSGGLERGHDKPAGYPRISKETKTTGWQPSCACDAEVVPCRVLDPFAGAGTTGLVADELGRDCTLIELNPEYAAMSRDRIYGAAPMFAAVEVA